MDWAVIIPVFVALIAPIGAVTIWFLNRKKHVAEIYSAISEGAQTTVETMQITMQELRIELESAHRKMDELIVENELLRQDLAALKQQNMDLIEQIHDMRVAYEQQLRQSDN